MLQVVAMSAATVAAFEITYNRAIGFKHLIRNAVWVDVAFTVVIGIVFYGTLTGMLVAVFSGLMLSVFLGLCKLCIRAGGFNMNAMGLMKTDKVRDVGGLDPSEFDKNGRWIYNEAPYV